MGKPSTQSGSLSSEKRKLLELRLKQKGISTRGTQEILRRKEMGPCPLSFAQQRLWFLDQLEPESTAYLIPRVLRMGEVDAHALEWALQELINRHESLRTTFEKRVGQPIQVIHPISPFTLPIIDLQGLSHELREHEGQRLARQEAQRPCDLTKGPLLRTYALRLDLQEHVLLLTLHHIITDGWSNQIVEYELTTLYQAFVEGQSSPLPPLPIQYADYAIWQRKRLQGEIFETQLSYWKKQLAGLTPLKLPTDRPRSAVRSQYGAMYSFVLPRTLSDALIHLSHQEGVTIFMTLLAVFQTLLYRYSGLEDIVVGTNVANRNQVEIENLIGFFVNQLVLRANLSGNLTFSELLKQVKTTTLDAYAHGDMPFEKLVEILQPKRSMHYAPLFQAKFILDNTFYSPSTPRKLPSFPEVTGKQHVVSTTTQLDLLLSLSQTSAGFVGTFTYTPDVFNGTTIEQMARHFITLVESINANPDVSLTTLEIIPKEEKERVIMQKENRARAAFSKFKKIQPSSVTLQPENLIQTEYLSEQKHLPPKS